MAARTLIAALAGVGALAAAALAVSQKAGSLPAAQLGLIISADVRGYLEPCGCSEHMLGGIDRLAAQVEQAKRDLGAAVHLAAGDTLFANPPQDAAHGQQDQLKARTLVQIFEKVGSAALALGPRDLPRGPAAIADAKPSFPVLGGGSGPGYSVQPQNGIALGVATGNDAAALIANVKSAKKAGAEVVVALAEFPMPALLPAGPALHEVGADVAVVGHQANEADGEENRLADASLPVLSLMSRGRSVARVELHRVAGAPPGFALVQSGQEQAREVRLRDAEIESLKKRAHLASGALKAAMEKKIVEKQAQRDALAARKPAPPAGRSWLSIELIQLSDDKPHSTAIHEQLDAFDLELGKLNLAWAKAHGQSCPAAKPGEPAFVGTQTCIGCHAGPAAVWQQTPHSHAYATLEKVHKQYDLDCVKCHVIGVDAPGGVCRVDQTQGRQNVGCESCHGRGSLHAGDPSVGMPVRTPAEANCRVCHTPENSTAFDYATYLPKILGPGHGRPMVRK